MPIDETITFSHYLVQTNDAKIKEMLGNSDAINVIAYRLTPVNNI